MIFMVAHWVGCLYYFMASCMNFDNSTWYHQVSAQFSGFDTHSSLMAQYLIAMYKGFNGLTNLGYENVLPNNVYEMVMSVVVIYLQILIAAYILGTMFNYLVKRDPEAGSHKTMMEKMDEFLKRHHIPKDLVEDIHNYMWFQYRKASSNRLLSMESLPRTLMIELAQHRYRHVLDQNTSPGCALHGCNELFLQELVTHLKDMFLMPGERYIRAGDVPTEVAFLNSGLLQIKDEAGVILRTIRADVKNMSTTVGDTSVFVNIEQQLDVFADESSAVHLLTIQRNTLQELLQGYPDQQEVIMQNVLKQFGLDKTGRSTGEMEVEALVGKDDANAERLGLKLQAAVQESLISAADTNFSDMAWRSRMLMQYYRSMELRLDVDVMRLQLYKFVQETSFLELLLNHPMMDPHCLFVERWRTFMVVPMSYEMWAVPFRIAMTSELSLNYALIYTDVLTDALFLVDALIRLQTKIPSLEGQPENTRAEVFWHVMQQNVLKQLLPCVCMYAVLGHTEAFWLFFLAQAPRIVVVKILHTGLHELQSTVLRMASSTGQMRIVELLVEEGATLNLRSRWGDTPLNEALAGQHRQVVELLRARGAQVYHHDPAGVLCDAASNADLSLVELLITNGVNPDEGDYDKRTALHLASAEGHDKVVEYLLSKGANVNIEDRWGGTPLLDAISHDQSVVINTLLKYKAHIPHGHAKNKLFTFASEGNLAGLSALAKCGIDFDTSDYDNRSPMHLAAAGGFLECVFFLLSRTANPDCRDRWNGTPLVDALSENSFPHLYAGKLLHSQGATLGRLEGTAEGEKMLQTIESITMEAARAHMKKQWKRAKLAKQGEVSVKTAIDQEMIFWSTMRLIKTLDKLQTEAVDISPKVEAATALLFDHLSRLQSILLKLVDLVEEESMA
eukprot:gene23779-28828_t